MRIIKYCLLAMLWPALTVVAQSSPATVGSLSIGDTVPDIEIGNLYNYPVSKIRISELKGKRIILDFWATWCGSCLAEFPKLQALQKEHSGQLQVILVNASSTGDDSGKIQRSFKKRRALTGFSVELPYTLEDTVLSALFPHRFIPHYIWIDQQGRIAAITGLDAVTEHNINAWLDEKKVTFTVKQEDFNFDKAAGNTDSFLYRSLFLRGQEGQPEMAGNQPLDGNRQKMFLVNYPLLVLLEIAFKQELSLPRNQILFKSTRQNPNSLYCYELILPFASARNPGPYIRSDLERYFRLSVVRKKMMTDCYLLRLNIQKAGSASGNNRPDIQMDTSFLENHLFQVPASSVAGYLDPYFKIPLISDVKSDQKVDIRLQNLKSEEAILKSLRAVGFTVTKEKCSLPIAQIEDNPVQ